MPTEASPTCAHGGSYKQVNEMFLVDTLNGKREMMYDRADKSLVKAPVCKHDKLSTNGTCTGQSQKQGYVLSMMYATYDRQTGKCGAKPAQ